MAASSSSSSQRPTAKTASLCSVETASGTHTFTITQYSLHSGIGADKFISSTEFNIGGHDWRIRYYPDGDGAANEEEEHVALHLELRSKATKVRLLYDFRLLLSDGESESIGKRAPATVNTTETESGTPAVPMCGNSKFIKKSTLEEFYLRDDCLVIECDVTVIKDSPHIHDSRETTAAIPPSSFDVTVPDSDLSEDLQKWQSEGTEVDIEIKVGDTDFKAHRLVLAMRSPIFKEKFYGAWREEGVDNITIEDVEPAVFKAMLHFIYTDTLPEQDQNFEMAADLLAAADRYEMERMKLFCASILCKGLTAQRVTHIIDLAQKHHCEELKDACIQFSNSSEERMAQVMLFAGIEKIKAASSNTIALKKAESSIPKSNPIFNKKLAKVATTGQANGDGSANAPRQVLNNEPVEVATTSQVHGDDGSPNAPHQVSEESDSNGESRSASPMLHWLASNLSHICEIGCLPSALGR